MSKQADGYSALRKLLNNFKIDHEKETFQTITENIENGVSFRGTNLWVLIFAIFIASLGLNVNSPAVVIGAMLISPLMGPIMGLGLSMGINNLPLLRRSISNYLLAAGVGLATSTIFFILSPLSDAHSEILSRTSPNIYDVLIAFFGGFAGIVATASKHKGNVIPGVAIATALMPPLCTAGFGLATLQISFFFGAFYLFLINTVFIALATFITIRFLKFPVHYSPEIGEKSKVRRLIWVVVIVTLLPSIYFGYDIVQQNKFSKNAEKFIEFEGVIPNDYLLKKVVDPKNNSILLVYGGAKIDSLKINSLRAKLKNYELENTSLEIKQGFAYLNETYQENKQAKQLNNVLFEKENELKFATYQLDSIKNSETLAAKILEEAQALYPSINQLSIRKEPIVVDSVQQLIAVAFIVLNEPFKKNDYNQFESWLKVRVSDEKMKTYFIVERK